MTIFPMFPWTDWASQKAFGNQRSRGCSRTKIAGGPRELIKRPKI